MLEIGIPSYLLNATLLGVLAQRLVRMLCADCKTVQVIDDKDWNDFVNNHDIPKPEKIYQPKGCDECRNTGFKGRAGLYEMLMMKASIRKLIINEADASEIRHAGIENGMNLLRISGALKVAEGLTTIEEVLRVAPALEDD